MNSLSFFVFIYLFIYLLGCAIYLDYFVHFVGVLGITSLFEELLWMKAGTPCSRGLWALAVVTYVASDERVGPR